MLQLFDMYRIRLEADGGEPELAATNPGDVLSWLTDAEFQIRGSAVRQGSSDCMCCRLLRPRQSTGGAMLIGLMEVQPLLVMDAGNEPSRRQHHIAYQGHCGQVCLCAEVTGFSSA